MTSDFFSKQRGKIHREILPTYILKGLEGTNVKGEDTPHYMEMYLNRYNRLTAILKQQVESVPIAALYSGVMKGDKFVSVMGLVSGLQTTKKAGAKIIQLEDPSGYMKIVITKKNEQLYSEAESLQLDEVVQIGGVMSDDRQVMFGTKLTRPDIPLTNKGHRSKTPAKVCMISDIHVGSDTFLPRAWDNFIRWISTSDVNFLLIAGDVVDGIGIYPGQDEELIIPDIYKQYEELGRMISRIPPHIRIVISLGNHDAVRGAEPQPALPEKFRDKYPSNCVFVENPAWVECSGVTFLMYHGRSFDDSIKALPGASYANIGFVMEAALKRRHLAITYGEKTPLIAASEDQLLIDPIPDVFLTGHVHILGITDYRGVLCVNAGCWQSQTKYQAQFGTIPTPGLAVVLDLKTFKYEIKDFTK